MTVTRLSNDVTILRPVCLIYLCDMLFTEINATATLVGWRFGLVVTR